jgi:hypothetical protein
MSLGKYKIIWYNEDKIEIGNRLLDETEYFETMPGVMHMEMQVDKRTPVNTKYWGIFGIDGIDDPIEIPKEPNII